MKKKILLFFVLFALVLSGAFALDEGTEDDLFGGDDPFGDFSEDDIFGDEDDLTVPKEEVIDDSITEELDKESVTFSGEINTSFGYFLTRDFLKGNAKFEENKYSAYIGADFLLDIRFRKGIKVFTDLFLGYMPSEQIMPRVFYNDADYDPGPVYFEEIDTAITIKEFFADMNINRHVYFRFGKQLIKWGRGYLWNPTDYINIQKKSFLDVDARREGVYGLKMSVPFGTLANIYGIVNVTDTDNPTDFAYAGKLEFLVKNVEFSISGWGKKNNFPMFGFDISGNILGIDVRAESSFSYGSNSTYLSGSGVPFSKKNEFVTRFCIGLTKRFDMGDVSDRLMINAEVYYNHTGYTDDMFEGAIGDLFINGNYYEYANYGKVYLALFTSVDQFILSDMTFNLNCLGNLNDLSFLLSTGISYEPVYNVTFTFNIISYLGKEDREFTYDGKTLGAEIGLAFKF